MSNRSRRGRAEREARKRHRRAIMHHWDGAAWRTLKLGRKKLRAHYSDFIVGGRGGKQAMLASTRASTVGPLP